MVFQIGAFVFEGAATPGAPTLTPLTQAPPDTVFGDYDLIVAMEIAGVPHVVAYKKASGEGRFYAASLTAPFFTQVAAGSFGKNWDDIQSFILGDNPYTMCYRRKDGRFEFRLVRTDLTLSAPYEFHRSHEPGTTSGFTMVRPFVSGGLVAFMGYNFASGAVAMYTLSVTAVSQPGLPPLLPLCVWAHQWAKNWTRFVFFQMGGANFFLKTNVGGATNVNIDRIMDGLVTGTVEVATQMNLADPLAQTLVAPLIFDDGQPHFISVKADGSGAIYRIFPNCLGWDKIIDVAAPANAAQLFTLRFGNKRMLLFC